jgi:hypothetical protein
MPSTGKHPNSFAIHSGRWLHWSIFVSDVTLAVVTDSALEETSFATGPKCPSGVYSARLAVLLFAQDVLK